MTGGRRMTNEICPDCIPGSTPHYVSAACVYRLKAALRAIQVTQVSGGTDSGSPQEEGRASGAGSSEATPDGPPASVSSKVERAALEWMASYYGDADHSWRKNVIAAFKAGHEFAQVSRPACTKGDDNG